MKITSYAVGRPAYYDRNAATVLAADSTIYAPHSGTVRATVTVAAGKKLFLELSSTLIKNETAPTVAANATSLIRITDTLSAFIDPVRTDVVTSADTATVTFHTVAGTTTIYAGETITLITANLSTGGTVLHATGIKGTLFDA